MELAEKKVEPLLYTYLSISARTQHQRVDRYKRKQAEPPEKKYTLSEMKTSLNGIKSTLDIFKNGPKWNTENSKNLLRRPKSTSVARGTISGH